MCKIWPVSVIGVAISIILHLDENMTTSHFLKFVALGYTTLLFGCSGSEITGSGPDGQSQHQNGTSIVQLSATQRSSLRQRFFDAYMFAISRPSVDTIGIGQFAFAISAVENGATPVQVSNDGVSYTMISYQIRMPPVGTTVERTASGVFGLSDDNRTIIFGAADDTLRRPVNFALRDTFVYPNAIGGIDAFGGPAFWTATSGSVAVSSVSDRGACIAFDKTISLFKACSLATITSSLEISSSGAGVNPHTNAFSAPVAIKPNGATGSRRFLSGQIVMIGPVYEY